MPAGTSRAWTAIAAAVLLFTATPAHAQFNLNRLIDAAKNLDRAGTEIDEKEEIQIGREIASNLLGAAPLVANDDLQRYVNKVGRWLTTRTERPDLPWQFGVLDAPQINAFATPGGFVFITRGLLARMRNEAELAGVLSHEIVHVLRRHHLKAIQKNAQAALAADVLSLAMRERGSAAREKLIALGTEMYARGLDRGDELEADSRGIVIAARAGYDSYGLPAVLQVLQSMNPEDAGLTLMFKTHPPPGDRLATLEKAMLPTLDAFAAQPQLAERFSTSTRPKPN